MQYRRIPDETSVMDSLRCRREAVKFPREYGRIKTVEAASVICRAFATGATKTACRASAAVPKLGAVTGTETRRFDRGCDSPGGTGCPRLVSSTDPPSREHRARQKGWQGRL